jgi:hypothetical protein
MPEAVKDRDAWLKLALGLPLFTAALYRLASTTADPDLWGYLAFGRLFWESGRFPYQDVFAYVPTLNPWVYHEWLTGVLYYPLYQLLGAAGLQLLKYGLGLTTLGLLYLTARKRGAGTAAALVVLFMVQGFLTLGYSPVRAQVFTYCFFALSLYLLETSRLDQRFRRLWVLVPLQVFWCNFHGGFMAGLGLVFLYALGEALSRRPFRAYLGILALAALATLINPYGLEYWHYIFQAVTMPRPEITEWASALREFQTGLVSLTELLYLVSLVVFALFLALTVRWRELTPGLVLLFTLYLGLKHGRHQVFFLLCYGAYLPSLLSAYFRVLGSRPGVAPLIARLGWKLPVLAGVLVALLFGARLLGTPLLSLEVPPWPKPGERVYYPVGAGDYLHRHHLSGKVLIHFDWGEYFLWTFYPRCLVAIDGRYETVYPDAVNRAYFDFIFAREPWRHFLERYPPDMILIPSASGVAALLHAAGNWRQVYADSGCALFLRR